MRRMVLIPEERLLHYERRENQDGKPHYENNDDKQYYGDMNPPVIESRAVDAGDYGLTDDIITRGIPKTMRTRAMALLERLKARPDAISWDSMGQVKLKGDLIPKSNISDLISDAMRPRKRFDPEGSRQFFCVLSEINVPRDLVRNEERWKESNDVPRISSSQDCRDISEPPRTGKGWVCY